MSHGKETPRQKMIGMMYLVLTAMLALNVQKEVLNAFINVDTGITKTTENFSAKNDFLFNAFESAAAENDAKAGKWRDLAFEVKKQTEELYQYMQGLKIEMVRMVDGQEAEAINENKVDLAKVQKLDNMDKAAELMLVMGKGSELKSKIEKYREFLLSIIDERDVSVRKSIVESLNTDPKPGKKGTIPTWESQNFEQLPLAGVITIMSGMQADLKNSESEALRYLFSMIDAGSFRSNKLEAVVIPKSNYVLRGNEYYAEIFVAAADTTQNPSIYIGEVGKDIAADGKTTYKMVGRYDSLQVSGGRGTYRVSGAGIGYRKWGGLIRLKGQGGSSDILLPFNQEYQVAEASLVVSPTKMNVFYVGVDNPIEISVPGVPSDKIFPSITNGTLTRSGGAYIVRPGRAGTPCVISVVAEIDGQRRSMGSKDFRVKDVPDPKIKVGNLKMGTNSVAAVDLSAQTEVYAELENFDFDLKFRVVGFSISTTVNGFAIDEESKTEVINQKQRAMLRDLRRGQKVFFDQVKAIGPDGRVRNIGTQSFTIK